MGAAGLAPLPRRAPSMLKSEVDPCRTTSSLQSWTHSRRYTLRRVWLAIHQARQSRAGRRPFCTSAHQKVI